MSDETPDVVTVLRVHLAGTPPGRGAFFLCRRSLAARLAADAATADGSKVAAGPDDTWEVRPGAFDEVTDLGPGALLLAQAADRARDQFAGYLLLVGIAQGGRWLRWFPPSPREPVPGTPGAAGQRN